MVPALKHTHQHSLTPSLLGVDPLGSCPLSLLEAGVADAGDLGSAQI